MKLRTLLAMGLVLVACDDREADGRPPDASVVDAPTADSAATPPDGAPADGAPADGAPADGTIPDGTVPDGTVDGSMLEPDTSADAAPPDALQPDAGVSFTPFQIEELAARRAVVRFETSRPTTCEAEYGLAGGALELRATDPDMEPGQLSIDHRVPLEDLLPDTQYEMRARATDDDDVAFFSEVVTFRTLPEEPPPVERINVAASAQGTLVSAVSSNWANGANDSGFGANNAIDGLMRSQWSTAGDGDSAWIELDLGQERQIEQIGYRSREMADGTSIVTSIRVLLDGDVVLGPYETPLPSELYTFDVDPPIAARTARFEAVTTTGGNTGAREVQLFAVPTPP